VSRIIRALDRHWFAPGSLRDLGIVRIVIVAGQLILLPGREAHLAFARASDEMFMALPALKILLLPFGDWGMRPEPALLEMAWLVAIVSGIAALIGLMTRPALLAFAASNTLLQAHLFSYGSVHHRQAILIIALWILAMVPSGATYSVDSVLRRVRRAGGRIVLERGRGDAYSEHARWPLRLVQWLFVLVYLSAGLSKLAAGGLEWFNGHTLSYYLVRDGWLHGAAPGVWLADTPLVVPALSVLTVAFEMTFVFAVLVPRLAPFYVLLGLCLHLGIYVTQRAPFFHFMFVYIVFIEPLRQYLFSHAPARLPAALRTFVNPRPGRTAALSADRNA
jgi:uncharacterized membrane protein YphA (DoxX/SURF4 family)